LVPALPGRFCIRQPTIIERKTMFIDIKLFFGNLESIQRILCYKQHFATVRICRPHLLSLLGNDLPALPLLAAAAPVELARAIASLRAMAHSQHSSILEACNIAAIAAAQDAV
jgi:hypothetical protein